MCDAFDDALWLLPSHTFQMSRDSVQLHGHRIDHVHDQLTNSASCGLCGVGVRHVGARSQHAGDVAQTETVYDFDPADFTHDYIAVIGTLG
jgi:hypothetical protein